MPHIANDMAFKVDSSLKEWQVPAQDWLDLYAKQKDEGQQKIDGLCTGSTVFDGKGRILLVQRADHDSSPGYWEVPGGAVDADDVTILHGAARELREETGLIAQKINHIVVSDYEQNPHGLIVFSNSRRTLRIGRFIFQVEVQDYSDVKLDPNEHQNFAWASQDEINDAGTSESKLQKMYPSMRKEILAAFRLHSEVKAKQFSD